MLHDAWHPRVKLDLFPFLDLDDRATSREEVLPMLLELFHHHSPPPTICSNFTAANPTSQNDDAIPKRTLYSVQARPGGPGPRGSPP